MAWARTATLPDRPPRDRPRRDRTEGHRGASTAPCACRGHAAAGRTEIGQVLRHRSPEAARRYAKVDLEALRAVALPWCDMSRRLLGGHSQTEGGSKYRTEGLIHAVTVWKTSSRGSATFAVGHLQSSGG